MQEVTNEATNAEALQFLSASARYDVMWKEIDGLCKALAGLLPVVGSSIHKATSPLFSVGVIKSSGEAKQYAVCVYSSSITGNACFSFLWSIASLGTSSTCTGKLTPEETSLVWHNLDVVIEAARSYAKIFDKQAEFEDRYLAIKRLVD